MKNSNGKVNRVFIIFTRIFDIFLQDISLTTIAKSFNLNRITKS